MAGNRLIRENIAMALEAHQGNISVGGQARWACTDGDTVRWIAALDLGQRGRWTLDIGTERPVPDSRKDLPAAVTVWLHPRTQEPRLLKTDLGLFYAVKFIERPDA